MKVNAAMSNQVSNPANVVYLVLLAFCLIFAASLHGSVDGGFQFYLLVSMILPAFVLAIVDSKYLLPFVIVIWAVAPEVRRVLDWSAGHFQPISLLSLAPLLATISVFIPIQKWGLKLTVQLRTFLKMLGGVLVYGLIIGLTHNGFACLYDLANYTLPLLVLLYAIAKPTDAKDRDFWITSFSTIAVLVAVYGWIQFLVAPAWDVFWMKNVPASSFGNPEPLKIRVFSTLNSPEPAGAFLAAALAPMFLEKRWRGMFGWVGVLLVASALAITLVRTSWLTLIAVIIAYIFLTSGSARWRKIATIAVVGLALYLLVPLLPGGTDVTSRIQTVGSLKQDTSANARSGFAADFIPKLVAAPLGLGLGTVGLGSKIDNSGKLGEYANFDNGFYALLITFGLPGTILFFVAVYSLGKAVRNANQIVSFSPYVRLALATLISVVCGLLSLNVLVGINGILIWLLVGTAFNRQPKSLSLKAE